MSTSRNTTTPPEAEFELPLSTSNDDAAPHWQALDTSQHGANTRHLEPGGGAAINNNGGTVSGRVGGAINEDLDADGRPKPAVIGTDEDLESLKTWLQRRGSLHSSGTAQNNPGAVLPPTAKDGAKK